MISSYMKMLFLLAISLALLSFTGWATDFEKAKQLAKEKHQLMLLNFSGSDWCAPCIRMKKEIFADPAFSGMADANLVLVNADFPRNKKNKLAERIKKQNETLADKYNPEGKFPYTVLLTPEGKVVSSWDGLPENAGRFTAQVKKLCDAYK